MTDFTTHTIESAPEAAKPLLKEARQKYGFHPNILGTMAEAPALLEGYMTFAGIFDKTNLTETERQIIMMTNNRLNGCVYCMSAHSMLSHLGGVPADVIESLRNGTSIADPKLEALRQFAIIINQSRGWPTDAQVEEFLSAGYTRQTVLEVIMGTALKTLSTYTNHVASSKLDDAFTDFAWTPPSKIAAE